MIFYFILLIKFKVYTFSLAEDMPINFIAIDWAQSTTDLNSNAREVLRHLH